MVLPVVVLVVTMRPVGVATAWRGFARIAGRAGIAGVAAGFMVVVGFMAAAGFIGAMAGFAGAMAGFIVLAALVGLAGLAAVAGAIELAGAAWAPPAIRVIAASAGAKRRNDIGLLPIHERRNFVCSWQLDGRRGMACRCRKHDNDVTIPTPWRNPLVQSAFIGRGSSRPSLMTALVGMPCLCGPFSKANHAANDGGPPRAPLNRPSKED